MDILKMARELETTSAFAVARVLDWNINMLQLQAVRRVHKEHEENSQITENT